MENDIIRHYLAATAYRFRQAINQLPSEKATFDPGAGVKSPRDILNHMSNVFAYAISKFKKEKRITRETLDWEGEVERFYQILEELDRIFQKPLLVSHSELKVLLQGPLTDVMTHIGQLAMLSRIAGHPIIGENFIKAPIVTGKVRY